MATRLCLVFPKFAFCNLIGESSSVWKRPKTSFLRHLTSMFFPEKFASFFYPLVLRLYCFCSFRARSFFIFEATFVMKFASVFHVCISVELYSSMVFRMTLSKSLKIFRI